jgi:hypothetical protein
MNYFKKINFEFEETLKVLAKNDIENFLINIINFKDQARIKHTFDNTFLDVINRELSHYGIPNVLYCQSYIRKKGHRQMIHVDGTNGQLINCAINIPLHGGDDSKFNWYSGEYMLIEKNVGDLYFYDLKWNSFPKLEESLELTDTHLVRVNSPHSAQASIEEDRWIFTMRFVGNPTFEELYEKL